jgi:hypothetical protein
VKNTVTVKYGASVQDSGSAKSSLPDPAIR